MKRLTIVIVNYNVKFYVEQCLYSIEKAMEHVDCDVYVVDNHSKDQSVAYLKPRFPWVHFIASNHNLGFARANNIAIRESQSDYVLLLNPDTLVGEKVLSDCVSFMDEHKQAGGIGVKMLTIDGHAAKESRRGLPTPKVSFYKMVGLCDRFPKHHTLGKYYMGYLPWDKPSQIEVISGAFCMLRRTALDKVGLLDEDFFMYGEDIDLSYRVLKGGYENWYLPCSILHYKGESTQKSSFRYVHVFYDAMLIFLKKHYGNASLFFNLPIKLAVYGKAALALIRMQWDNAVRSLGFVDQRQRQFPQYVFIGSAETLARCKEIAEQKALSGLYFEGDRESLPQGHLSLIDQIDTSRLTIIVYDMEAYRYEDMLNLFAERPIKNVEIGTYHPQSGIIITPHEVY